MYIYIYIRRKFRSQTSDNMDRWKAEMERVREKRKSRREKSRREKSRRKKIQVREKVGKSRNTMFFQWFVAPEGLKSRLAKAAGAEPSGQMRDEKVHAVVARRCAKHISKSKCAKHTMSGPLLEVAMSKKCTPLWREAHFEVKITNHTSVGPVLEVEMSKTPLWCEAHFLHYTTLHYNYNYTTTLNYTTLHYISLHYIPLHSIHYTTLHYTTLHWMTLHHR